MLTLRLDSPANRRAFHALLWRPEDSATAASGRRRLAIILHGRQPATMVDGPATIHHLYPFAEALQTASDYYGMDLCIPLMGNKAYCDSPIDPYVRHATFLGDELPGLLAREHGATSDRLDRCLIGFSMGGTGAINILARHAERFAIAVNFAGNCDPAFYPTTLGCRSPAEDVLGPYETHAAHFVQWSNFHAVTAVAGRRDVAIALGCGRDDPRLANIRRLHRQLLDQGTICTYGDYPGGHVYDLAHVLLQCAAADHLWRNLRTA